MVVLDALHLGQVQLHHFLDIDVQIEQFLQKYLNLKLTFHLFHATLVPPHHLIMCPFLTVVLLRRLSITAVELNAVTICPFIIVICFVFLGKQLQILAN